VTDRRVNNVVRAGLLTIPVTVVAGQWCVKISLVGQVLPFFILILLCSAMRYLNPKNRSAPRQYFAEGLIAAFAIAAAGMFAYIVHQRRQGVIPRT
jgi:hypothetical protein